MLSYINYLTLKNKEDNAINLQTQIDEKNKEYNLINIEQLLLDEDNKAFAECEELNSELNGLINKAKEEKISFQDKKEEEFQNFVSDSNKEVDDCILKIKEIK